ncbi:MAG: monovalent cation/H(+) antiporter subunit G [Chloroflexota bacterium]|nr:monovalent cation/H(+) antiporter subunit G [Chloroflexota bacterium]MDE2970468.1 monovalent cation/H(+) antiporter subunit G [Chloroflexota bacterium]
MNIVALALMAAGLFFMAIAVIGLVRLPDFFSRVHAVSKSETLGITLLLLGLLVSAGVSLTGLKLALIVLFVAISNPVGVHVLTRAAVRNGLMPWRRDGLHLASEAQGER